MKERIRKLVSKHPIEDVYLTGFVDIEEGVVEFCPEMRYLYLQFGEEYLELESVNQFSKLKITIAESVNHNFEIDEDMSPARASIDEVILVDTLADNRINSMKLINSTDETDKSIICDALELQLKSGQLIFVDPSFHYGIGLGGMFQKKYWENNAKKESIEEIILD